MVKRLRVSVPQGLWRMGQRRFYGGGRDSDGGEFLFRVSGVAVERAPVSRWRSIRHPASQESPLAWMSFEWIAAFDSSECANPSIDVLQTPSGGYDAFWIEGLESYWWITDMSGVEALAERGPLVADWAPGVAATLRGEPVLGGLAPIGERVVEGHVHEIVGVTIFDCGELERDADWRGAARPEFRSGKGAASRPRGFVPASIEIDLAFEWCAIPVGCAARSGPGFRGGSNVSFAGRASYVACAIDEMRGVERGQWEEVLRNWFIVL